MSTTLFNLAHIVQSLCTSYGARLFDEQDSLQGNDVDIWISVDSIDLISRFLQKEGFVCEQTSSSLIARRFVDGKLEVLDLIFSKSYLTNLFFAVSLRQKNMEQILQDRSLERTLRYLLLKRNDPTAKKWIAEHGSTILSRYDVNTFFSIPIFKKHSPNLTILGKICYVIGLLLRFYKRIGSGRVIAVTGPDGAGKSTIIQAIKTSFDVRVVYMGDWAFAGQKLYDRLMEGPRLFHRFVYPFFYCENWMRLMRVWWYKWCGRLVITDRYPGTNRHLAKRESLYRMNNAMYAFFPHPDQFVIISAPVDVIYARKQELNPQEIELLLTRLRKRLPKQKTTEIVNINLDDSLNAFMRVMYERGVQAQ